MIILIRRLKEFYYIVIGYFPQGLCDPLLYIRTKLSVLFGLGSTFQGLDTNQECCYQLPISE
jgi:hypothetical protein